MILVLPARRRSHGAEIGGRAECAGAVADGSTTFAVQHRADRLRSRRPDPWRWPCRSGAMPSCSAGVQRAGAAHAAHHFVEDQQHAVPVADLADALEVAWPPAGRQPSRRAAHRLGDEAPSLGPRPQSHESWHPAPRAPAARRTAAASPSARTLLAILAARRHVAGHRHQQRRERCLRRHSRCRPTDKRAQRVAVVAPAGARCSGARCRLARSRRSTAAPPSVRTLDRFRSIANVKRVAGNRRARPGPTWRRVARRLLAGEETACAAKRINSAHASASTSGWPCPRGTTRLRPREASMYSRPLLS